MCDIHQNYDAVCKDALTVFDDKIFDFLEIDMQGARLTDALSTEYIDVNTEFSDLLFKTDKGFGVHIEEEVNISKEDLLRFCGYQVKQQLSHKIECDIQ